LGEILRVFVFDGLHDVLPDADHPLDLDSASGLFVLAGDCVLDRLGYALHELDDALNAPFLSLFVFVVDARIRLVIVKAAAVRGRLVRQSQQGQRLNERDLVYKIHRLQCLNHLVLFDSF